MIAAKLVLSYPIWKGMLNVGSEGTFVKRDDSNENCGAELPNSLSKVKDNTYAGFVDYGLALSKSIHANVGLRYEHVSFDFQDLLNPSHSMERHYNDWFPSAGINAQIGKVRLMLSFSSRTNRPSFWQLNNSVTYHNRYAMQRGNATLKPSKEKSFSLISMVGMFTAGVHYSYVTDQICFWGQQINEEGGIMFSHKNLDKPQHSMNLFLTALMDNGICEAMAHPRLRQWQQVVQQTHVGVQCQQCLQVEKRMAGRTELALPHQGKL